MELNIDAQYPFSPGFQRRILAALLQDPTLYSKYYGVWSYKYFGDGNLQSLAHAYFDYRAVTKTNPSQETMMNEVVLRNDRSSDEFKLKLIEELEALYSHEVVDKEWTEKTIIEWAKNQAIESAVIAAAESLAKGEKRRVQQLINEAVKVGDNVQQIGTFVQKGMGPISAQLLQQKGSAIPTGFADIDLLIGGGPGPGEMLVFIGPPKGFKSGNMLNATIPALCAPYNKNVTYVSLELGEVKVLERYAYRITKMTKDQLKDDPAEFDKRFLSRVEEVVGGKLAIKNYPVRTMTPSMLRAQLDLLDAKGHVTGLLVVDYGNIMKPEHSDMSEWSSVGSSFEALRAVAIERNIPVITAARTNRESLQTDNLQMHHIAGSMEIAATCDYGIALIQNEGEHKDWVMRQKLLLNRNEEANIVVDCKIDYKTYSIWNTGIRPDTEDNDSGDSHKEERGGYRNRSKETQGAPTNHNAGSPMRSLSPERVAALKGIITRK